MAACRRARGGGRCGSAAAAVVPTAGSVVPGPGCRRAGAGVGAVRRRRAAVAGGRGRVAGRRSGRRRALAPGPASARGSVTVEPPSWSVAPARLAGATGVGRGGGHRRSAHGLGRLGLGRPAPSVAAWRASAAVGLRLGRDGLRRRAAAATATCAWLRRHRVPARTCFTSTAPAVTITAAASPAAAFEASGATPAETAPLAVIPPAAAASAARPPRRRAAGGALRRRAAAPPPAPALAPRRPSFATHELLDEDERADRVDRGQRPVGLAQLAAEGAAAVAGACRWRRSGAEVRARPSATCAELEPDLVAGEQARLGGLGQRHARAHEERLHARHRGVHRLGDLVVRERVDLAQEQRGALRLRQLAARRRRSGGTPRACAPCPRCWRRRRARRCPSSPGRRAAGGAGGSGSGCARSGRATGAR